MIYGADGRRAWWGLVWAARIQDGQAGAWLSLGDLVNRARTVYGLLEPEATGAGLRQSTAWADDLTSQGIYGVKEGQYSLDLASTTQAESFRSSNLAQHARISPRPVVTLAQGESLVTLDLRGWWDTLGWRFYENSTGLIENTNRLPQVMKNVCTAAGERMGQSITVSDNNLRIESIWFCLRRVSSSSTITVALCSDSGGSPGTVLASATMSGALLSKSPRWTRFLLSSPVSVSAGTYWITIRDAGLANYRILADSTMAYTGGVLKVYASGAWGGASGTVDLQFRVAGTMETTEQIKLMAASGYGGQFLAGVKVDQASGLYTNPHRSGDTTALEEIQAHLEAGTSGGEPLQAVVNADRYLVVSQRPDADSAPWIVRNDGIIRLPGGQEAQPGPDMAGTWAVLDTKWSSSSASWLQSPGRVFIERVEWAGGVCKAVSPQAVSSLTEATAAG